MGDSEMYKVAHASVYMFSDDTPFIVCESPAEIAELVEAHKDDDSLICLTLGTYSEWNGKPLYVRPSNVIAIAPPKSLDEDDE